MKKASISILKARLSQYLDAVKGGEDVLVTERGRPVARITSVDQEGAVTGRAVQLVREGRMRAPMGQRPREMGPAPGPRDLQGRSLKFLLDERADSR